jgi:hypothetical protein
MNKIPTFFHKKTKSYNTDKIFHKTSNRRVGVKTKERKRARINFVNMKKFYKKKNNNLMSKHYIFGIKLLLRNF